MRRGMADDLVEDDADRIAAQVRRAVRRCPRAQEAALRRFAASWPRSDPENPPCAARSAAPPEARALRRRNSAVSRDPTCLARPHLVRRRSPAARAYSRRHP